MGNVIQWADAIKALETIAQEQELVSGMSVAEAAAARGFTKAASGMYLKTVITTAADSVVGTTAAEVAAAASTGATTSAVNLTLVEGAGGTASVAGIGSVALPIAACLAGAVGGYLIGKELNKNPTYSQFFDNLVFKTCDFITGQHLAEELINENKTLTAPLLYDADGNTYLPSELTANVKSYLDALAAKEHYSSLGALCLHYNISTTKFSSYLTQYPFILVIIYSNDIFIILSKTPIVYEPNPAYSGLTITGETKSWAYHPNGTFFSDNSWSIGTRFPMGGTNHPIFTSYDVITKGTGAVYYGTVDPTAMPSGVTKYTPSTTIVTTPITDPNGKVWKRVFLPSTPPTEMPDGEPVPEVAPSPTRLTPYISPVQPQPPDVPVVVPDVFPANPIVLPNPEPDASTAPYPTPDPTIDPSQLADPISDPEPVEPIPDPINIGAPVLPVVPSVPAPSSAKGLLHVYNPTPAQVDLFGEWLWTTFSGDIIDTISKLFNNPMDAVIGLHELYCTPSISAADVNIRAGYLESNVPSRLVTSRYKEIKCGAISVPGYWGNYLDYSPYTKSYCYLPFIGIVELNTDDIVGSGVEITYRIDTYNGSCIALITTAKPNSDESVSYQFEGNCAVTVPITSGMMTAAQNALIGIATTALSAGATAAVTVATGGTALPAAAMLGTVAAGASKQGLTSKNQVQYSGSFGSSFGAMGIKIPFLIIKRPRQKVVYGYNENYGYPAHTMVLISTCTGYLKAIEVDVISPTATEAEKKMIEQLLKSGVFVD